MNTPVAAMFVDPPAHLPSPFARWLFGFPGLSLLLACYLFLGQHHAPWLGEDLRHLLPAWEHAQGALLPPSLTHPELIPWGPLFAWSAAALGQAAQALGFPFHLGSRLATPIWLAVAALSIAFAARTLFGRTGAFVAAIATLTPLGWLLFAHVHTALAPAVAGLALLAAAAVVPGKPLQRAVIGGTALLGLFWSAGWSGLWLALGVLPLVGIAVPPQQSKKPHPLSTAFPPVLAPAPAAQYRIAWVVAALSAVGALLVSGWVVIIEPSFAAWLSSTWPAWRLVAPEWLTLITRPGVWTLWPLWLVALWPNRFSFWWRDPTNARLGLATLLTAAVVLAAFPVAESTPLLLGPILALAATARLLRFGPGTLAAFSWFSVMLTLILIAAALLIASAQWLSWPPGLARFLAQTRATPLVADPQWRLPAALAVILLWGVLNWQLPRHVVRAASHWLLSVTLLWILTLLLLFPWLDGSRNITPTLSALVRQPVVAAHQCLAPHPSVGVDVVAALRYHLPAYADPDCPLTLVRLRVATLDEAARSEWQRWTLARATFRDGKRREWWLVLPKGATPLARLSARHPIEE